MSSASLIDDTRILARGLEDREQLRSGGTRDEARARLASRIGIAPGTLYTLARGRLKKLDGFVRDRIGAYAVRDLQLTIERLTHELEMARQMGAHPMSPRMGEIERHLTAVRALLAESGRGAQ